MRCIECGKGGHLKCTSVRKSSKIKLSFAIQNNLDAFFEIKEVKVKKSK